MIESRALRNGRQLNARVGNLVRCDCAGNGPQTAFLKAEPRAARHSVPVPVADETLDEVIITLSLNSFRARAGSQADSEPGWICYVVHGSRSPPSRRLASSGGRAPVRSAAAPIGLLFGIKINQRALWTLGCRLNDPQSDDRTDAAKQHSGVRD